MTYIYRYILKEAWQITRHNRWLWFFGLFAALLGNGGLFNVLIRNITTVQNQGGLVTELNSLFSRGMIGALSASLLEVMGNLNIVSILTLVVILILLVFLLWLAVVTQGGLISGAFRLQKRQATDFKESWQRGLSKFWPVLWLNVGSRAVTYLLLVALGLPFFFLYLATQNLVWQWVFLVISFMLFVPLAAIVAAIVQYAVMFVVTKNSSLGMSLKEGWGLFKKNWIVSIEMALVLFLVNVAAGVGLLVGVMFLILPFLIIGFIAVYFSINILFTLAFILGIITMALAVFLFGAVLAVFQTTAWVTLFTRLTEGVIIPKILRLAASWSARKDATETTV